MTQRHHSNEKPRPEDTPESQAHGKAHHEALHRKELEQVVAEAARMQQKAQASEDDVDEDELNEIAETTGVPKELLLKAQEKVEARVRLRKRLLIGGAIALVLGGWFTRDLWWDRLFPLDAKTAIFQADGLRKQAEAARKNDNSGEAIRLASRAVRLNPSNLAAWNILALAHEDEKDISDARKAYEQGIQHADRSTDAARLYNNYATLLGDTPGTREEALAVFKQTLAIKPDYSMAYNNLGWTYAQMGRKQEAEAAYRKAIQLDPTNDTAHGNLASLSGNQSASSASDSSTDSSLDNNLKARELYAQMKALRKQGKAREAIQVGLQATRLSPKDVDIWNRLGLSYEDDEQLVQAAQAYKQGIKVGGDTEDAAYPYYNLGRLASNAKNTQDAIHYYVLALKCYPGYAAAHNNLGWQYEKIGHKQDAIAEYQQAVKDDPSDDLASKNLKRLSGG